MVRGGSIRRLAIGALSLALAGAGLWATSATGATAPSNNLRILDVSLPGPFNGCTFLSPGATPTSDSILDLVRPSAFLTNPQDNLEGEGGPIASAELTSLTPETVQYTIAANEHWSDGAAFTGTDLVAWYDYAKTLPSVLSDGYRDIKRIVESKDHLALTVTFTKPDADWNLLFRDVEAIGASRGCAIGQLVDRPSLGPYVVTSASASRVVLTMNHHWPVDTTRFGRIVITDADTVPTSPATQFVNFSLDVARSQVQTISAFPTVLSHIGTSTNIEEMTFAPGRPFTSRLAVRQALSWAIARQAIITQLWSSVTFLPSVAASALYAQGQTDYPGTGGSGPNQSTTTTVVTPGSSYGLEDCVRCALDTLATNGFTRTTNGWFTKGGYELRVRVARGPSAIDVVSAASAQRDWARIGIPATIVAYPSEVAAARAAASGAVDAAIFTRPTLSAPSYTARSWSGPSYVDSYPSGWRSPQVNALYAKSIADFNPVTASSTWLSLDQLLQTSYWVRPLFTDPSLMSWSDTVGTVEPTFSVAGLVDQLPTWTTISPTTSGS